MEYQRKKNQIVFIMAFIAAVIFTTAVYALPSETFLGIFSAGLFLIPASFFVRLIQKVAKTS